MIGQTISHYRILDKLGEGGMGVVYRAQDTHLDRAVAIKVLPAEAVANPERKRRFVQEARAASALNHPNIITIYDIDAVDGVDFIAMEYVAGHSLGQLIAGRGLRLGEALKASAQIADALAAAHAAGIVHRDLKPGNIMVNEQGRVKVLDFGLAKLTEPVSSDASAPTETLRVDAPRTEEGTIVGTVAYMSPEQAEGRPVDARSDIFSFGSVLHEMLTGQRAFSGQTRLSTLSAILRDSPKPLREGLEAIPPDLDKIVARCLRKDAARRFQHMDDVKIALDDLREESQSGDKPAPASQRPRVSAFPRLAVLLTAAAGIALGAAVTWWLARSRPAPEPVLTRLTSDAGLTFEPALSPDGKLVAYASDRSGEGNLDIWVQQVGGGLPIRLTRDPADDMQPDFSPDGRTIALVSTRGGGGIYVVPALGGDARLVAEGGRYPRFSPDGREIAYFVGDEVFSGRIQIVAATGGQPRPFQPEFRAAIHPVWSPDGRRLLFQGRKGQAQESWWVAPVDGGPAEPTGASAALGKRRLALFGPNGSYGASSAWVSPGNRILFSARSGDSFNVWRMPVSPSTGHVTGEPQRVTLGTARERDPSGAGDLIAFSSLNSQADLWSLPVEAASGRVTGPLERLTNDAAEDIRPSVSLDGKKLVFLTNRAGNADVWLKDLATGKERAVTATPVQETRVRISADGSRVMYTTPGPRNDNYWVDAAGGLPRKICSDCGVLLAVSPDGSRIIVWPGGQPIRLYCLEITSGRRSEILPHATWGRYRPVFSSDGRWLTFAAGPTTDTRRVFVAPFRDGGAGGESEWIQATRVASDIDQPEWSPDGSVIYFLSTQDGSRCIWAQRLDPPTKRPVGESFEVQHFPGSRRSLSTMNAAEISLSVARDKLVFAMTELTGNVWLADFSRQ